jgi:FkbM family methyltransferase
MTAAPGDLHDVSATGELLGLLGESLAGLRFVDVGAYGALEEEVFRAAVLADSRVVGFEADPVECERLNRAAAPNRRYLPHFVGDGGPATFRACRSPWTSSLLEPNAAFLSQYENLAELCAVTSRRQVSTVRLADAGLEGIDFLKLDIQGATLAALQGAGDLLGGSLVVHAEVEFVPIYQGQPLFADCEPYLRGRGFMFHHFHRLEGRRVRAGDAVVGRLPSQTLWADAVFVPSLDRLDALPARAACRLAWLLHTIYGAHDFALRCLVVADGADRTDLATRYRRALARAGLEA